MLVIRLQRTGRRGHAQFRVVVQDSRFTPTSGRVVAYVGSYDPHAKQATLDIEKISSFLSNGAQPSPRVVSLLKQEKIKLPEWVQERSQKSKAVRKPEKRRSTAPEASAEPATESEAVADSTGEEVVASDTPAPEAQAAPATEETEAPAEESAAEGEAAADATPEEAPAPEEATAEPEAEVPTEDK